MVGWIKIIYPMDTTTPAPTRTKRATKRLLIFLEVSLIFSFIVAAAFAVYFFGYKLPALMQEATLHGDRVCVELLDCVYEHLLFLRPFFDNEFACRTLGGTWDGYCFFHEREWDEYPGMRS